MKPLFNIIALFPEHRIYCEPFVGGGSVYWKKEPSEYEVINDIDKPLMTGYRLIQKVTPNPQLFPQNLNTVDRLPASYEHYLLSM
jgi:site-specific DNA-adenine methylase